MNMFVKETLALLPDTKGVIVVLSGGMDSTIAMRLCVEKYRAENVRALTFFYGQKQQHEIECAKRTTELLGVKHKIFDLSVLGEISKGFSANVDTDINMPTIKDVLGDPRPKTYVPNRNMILMSVAAAFAEVENIDTIVMGLQIHDEYGYHDTTKRFVNKVNDTLSENRIIKINVIAPFASMSKYDEINILWQLDQNVDLLKNTLTCYNPDEHGKSCGKCPSCSERIGNFAKYKLVDPIEYSVDIPWEKIIK
jgi:7-cyano-7-deazaguanine synthase